LYQKSFKKIYLMLVYYDLLIKLIFFIQIHNSYVNLYKFLVDLFWFSKDKVNLFSIITQIISNYFIIQYLNLILLNELNMIEINQILNHLLDST